MKAYRKVRKLTETLVLIPGLLCDDKAWKHQIETLSQNYEVRVPQLTRFTSIKDMALSILEAAPALISIAGHSMGGRVAMEMIRLQPDRIARLALFDTGLHTLREGEMESRQKLVDLAYAEGMDALAKAWMPPMVAEGALVSRPALHTEIYEMVMRMTPEIFEMQIKALLGRPEARSTLSAIDCPVLVGVGEKDRWSPPEQAIEIVRAIPRAQYVILSDCGHMAPMERPEEVTKAMAAWMRMPVTVPQHG